ncbi:MAG: hypothetical protein HY724_06700 [Candidatus Rokubacteria bacterium]|nr:hypothetical protein [Candidatus Rokubacteria bacterium]
MTFVVRSVFHWALGKRKKVTSSLPPSWRLFRAAFATHQQEWKQTQEVA